MIKVKFGKFKNSDLIEMVEKNPAYAAWYANKCLMTDNYDDYVVISEMIDVSANWIDFGKYINQKLEDILDKDAKYITWLSTSDWVKLNRPRIYKEANKLLGN